MLAKSGKLRDQTAGRIHGDRVPVENELIVTADGVAIKDGPLVSARERRHHFITNRRFMQRERRRAQVENYVSALFDQTSSWFAVIKRAGEVMFGPNILANGDADFFPVQVERLDPRGRLEIAVLIENIVSRQKRFVRFANRLSAPE